MGIKLAWCDDFPRPWIWLQWDVPSDDGGMPLDLYNLQISSLLLSIAAEAARANAQLIEEVSGGADAANGAPVRAQVLLEARYGCPISPVQVQAQTEVGISVWSAALDLKLLHVPEPPSTLAADEELSIGESFVIEWSPPSSDNGSPIILYEILLWPVSAGADPLLVADMEVQTVTTTSPPYSVRIEPSSDLSSSPALYASIVARNAQGPSLPFSPPLFLPLTLTPSALILKEGPVSSPPLPLPWRIQALISLSRTDSPLVQLWLENGAAEQVLLHSIILNGTPDPGDAEWGVELSIAVGTRETGDDGVGGDGLVPLTDWPFELLANGLLSLSLHGFISSLEPRLVWLSIVHSMSSSPEQLETSLVEVALQLVFPVLGVYILDTESVSPQKASSEPIALDALQDTLTVVTLGLRNEGTGPLEVKSVAPSLSWVQVCLSVALSNPFAFFFGAILIFSANLLNIVF